MESEREFQPVRNVGDFEDFNRILKEVRVEMSQIKSILMDCQAVFAGIAEVDRSGKYSKLSAVVDGGLKHYQNIERIINESIQQVKDSEDKTDQLDILRYNAIEKGLKLECLHLLTALKRVRHVLNSESPSVAPNASGDEGSKLNNKTEKVLPSTDDPAEYVLNTRNMNSSEIANLIRNK